MRKIIRPIEWSLRKRRTHTEREKVIIEAKRATTEIEQVGLATITDESRIMLADTNLMDPDAKKWF